MLRIVVNARVPSEVTVRAAERIADTLCGEQDLINRGPAVYVGRSVAMIDGRQRTVVVYTVEADPRPVNRGRRAE